MTAVPLADDPRHLLRLARHFRDHEAWCSDALTIRDQKTNLVKFSTYPGPRKLNDAIAKQQKLGKPVRVIALKARRVFISAGISTHVFKSTAFFPGRHAIVIAHKVDSAIEIHGYYKDFARYYTPAGAHLQGAIVLPPLAKSGQGERSIAWEGDSWIKVFAGVKDIGRGVGAHALHISEAAYIRNLGQVKTGLLNTMGDHAETMAFQESTANGASGEFYEEWQAANDPRSGSSWAPVFLAWWEHPSNQMEIPGARDQFERSLCQEERDLQRTYTLTLKQLYWRRWAIANKCNRSAKTFAQEYPCCPEEAFLLSGRPAFNHISLGRHQIIREPITGKLKAVEVGTRSFVRFEPVGEGDQPGPVVVYRRPQAGEIYALGGDTASGKDPNFGSGNEVDSDPDYCAASVIHCGTGEQVATIRERWTAPMFAEWLYMLGWWYNWAYLVPESNNHGQAVIAELLRLNLAAGGSGYPLARIHVRERQPGDRRPVMLHELGFLTNVATRPNLIGGLSRAIDEMAVIIRDAKTIDELRKMVIWPDGVERAAAGKGNHDDTVIALALGVVGLVHAPRIIAAEMRKTAQSRQQQRNDNRIVRYGHGVRALTGRDLDGD